jgi:hypothetical protein
MVRGFSIGVLGLALVATSCGRTPFDESSASTPATPAANAHPRQPYFTPGSPNYGYYEGVSVRNGCTQDASCLVTGCTDSTCAAEEMQITDDDFCQSRMYAQRPEPGGASCGCLAGECRWYFENDFDRHCEVDADCHGLGPPEGGYTSKAIGWRCTEGTCGYTAL